MRKPLRSAGIRIPFQWLIRATLSSIVLGIIFWLLPIEDVWRAIKNVPLELWSLVLSIFLVGHMVAALKWWLITNEGDDISVRAALKAHFAGLAANLCLPGVAGGDVLRASLVFRDSDDKTRVAIGSLTDRLLDVHGLLILSAIGIAFSNELHDAVAGPLNQFAIYLLLISVLVVFIAIVVCRLPLTGSLAKIADKITLALRNIGRHPGRLALCLFLSIAIQAVFIQLNIALAAAAGVHLPAVAWFFAWPLAKLIAAVPISLAGLGVREASLAALLVPLGGDATQIVAVGLVWQTILFAGGAISGVLLFIGSISKRPAIDEGAPPLRDQ